MGCSASFAKLILFIFNVAFFLFGVASLAVGIWVAVSKDELFKFINLLDNKLASGSGKQEIENLANQNGLIVISAYVLIGVGVFTLLVGFCGCCGAIKESNCLLYTYASLIGVVLVIEIVAAILAGVFQSRIRSTAEQALFDLNENYFVAIPDYVKNQNQTGTAGAKAAVTYLVNMVQVSFDCCGAKTVNDISNSTSWKSSDRTFKGKKLVNSMTCCKLISSSLKTEIKTPTAVNWTNFDQYLSDKNCPFEAKSNSLHTKTCYQGLLDYIGKYSTVLIGICVGIGLVELLGIVLACCLVSALKNDNAYKS